MPNDRIIALLFQDNIITAYEMLTDFRNTDILQKQLADLTEMASSISGVIKSDEASNTNTEVRIILKCYYWHY